MNHSPALEHASAEHNRLQHRVAQVTMARRYGVQGPIERPRCSVPRQLGQLISHAARYCGLFLIVLRPAG